MDVCVTADTLALHRIWVGHRTFADALRSGEVTVTGPRDLVRALPSWFQRSMFAHVSPVQAGGRIMPPPAPAAPD